MDLLVELSRVFLKAQMVKLNCINFLRPVPASSLEVGVVPGAAEPEDAGAFVAAEGRGGSLGLTNCGNTIKTNSSRTTARARDPPPGRGAPGHPRVGDQGRESLRNSQRQVGRRARILPPGPPDPRPEAPPRPVHRRFYRASGRRQ